MPHHDMPLVEARSLTVSYGSRTAVDGVSFVLHAGSFAGLIGPNGAGKTTLLLALSGQFKPRSGRVLFFGLDAYGTRHGVHRQSTPRG